MRASNHLRTCEAPPPPSRLPALLRVIGVGGNEDTRMKHPWTRWAVCLFVPLVMFGFASLHLPVGVVVGVTFVWGCLSSLLCPCPLSKQP